MSTTSRTTFFGADLVRRCIKFAERVWDKLGLINDCSGEEYLAARVKVLPQTSTYQR